MRFQELTASHPRLAMQIAHAIDTGRLPHGLLLWGHDTQALEMAALAITEKNGGSLQRIVPDEKGNIGIDAIRTANNSAQLTHRTGQVLWFDKAHTMGLAAQNALLKLLEEPPSNTLIILTCSSPSTLLQTLRSRCAKLPVAPMKDAVHEPSSTLLRKLSGNDPERMDEILGSDYAQLYTQLADWVKDPPKPHEMLKFASEHSTQVPLVLAIIESHVCDALAAGPDLRLAATCRALVQTRARAKTNPNPTLTLETTLLTLAGGASPAPTSFSQSGLNPP